MLPAGMSKTEKMLLSADALTHSLSQDKLETAQAEALRKAADIEAGIATRRKEREEARTGDEHLSA